MNLRPARESLLKPINLTPDHRRLIASLGFNVIAKLPGIASVFIVLPLVSEALGPSTYGELLSALALGSLFLLPFGGINAVGRRLLAASVGAHNEKEQANIFVTTIAFVTAAAVLAAAVMIAITGRSWTAPIFILVSVLPILSGFLNTFDNLRASYNEHYMTAVFQLIFQVVIYAAVYWIGLPQGGIILASLALLAPYGLASICTLVALLLQRPFLLRGKIEGLRPMVMPAIGVIMADGALGMLLSFSVYYLNLAGDPQMAAWVGTFSRLFSSFISPVLLIMFPLTSYISIRWGQMEQPRKLFLHRLFVVTGLVYGVVVGCAMAFAGPLYIDRMFSLTVKGDSLDVFALSLFMGAVVAQKAYTLLLYAVSEAKFISFGTALVASAGALAAAASLFWLPPARSVDVLFIVTGLGLPVLLLVGGHRQRRGLKQTPPTALSQPG
ncbi:hypothetical protein [Methylocella silvestris]|uniref:hypothetical protein n=1 Tax=Methylocella silvestris TaxID=199596 RepID=UPI0015E13975|nr:hypothetical protein [Methylocella silvestris]